MNGRELLQSHRIWVLVPSVVTDDPNLRYYYDFTQSHQEYTRAFEVLQADWSWQPVTMDNMRAVIDGLREHSKPRIPLVFNLCDGDEVNGAPGLSVIHALESNGITYTGSDAAFYELTTSKITMKRAFDQSAVAHAPWAIIEGPDQLHGLLEQVGTPALLKPAVSGGSMGLTVRNVVSDDEALHQRILELHEGYRGWSLTSGGLLAERFIKGPEYTSLIIGSADDPQDCLIYEPVERVFHASLPETERFLSFDRLWEIYEDESAMPQNDHFYAYQQVDPVLSARIKQLTVDAYCAVKGQGYGRVDIRMDSETGQLYVLEVNAQCGLSEDEDYTSIGAILRMTGKPFATMVMEILEAAKHR